MNTINHKFGNLVIIEEGASVHETCDLGPFTIVYSGTVINENVKIGSHSIIGKKPSVGNNQMQLITSNNHTLIEKNTIIGDHAIVYNGAKIGAECYLADKSFIRENVQIGKNVVVGTSVTISFNARVDNNTKIMTGTNVGGNMQIGKNCFIGAHVCSVNDNYPNKKTKREHQLSAVIEDNVIIGSNTTILPNLKIKKGITVAAGSVITKNLEEENGMYVGIPATKRK